MIAIIAPFPAPDRVTVGWMARVAAVDSIFSDEQRVYLNIQEYLPYDFKGNPQRHGDLASEYELNIRYSAHYSLFRQLLLEADLVYVHTMHAARYVLPFLKTDTVVVDIHGIAPEEELLHDRPAHAEYYADVERCVMEQCSNLIVVTDAMANHLRAKYPDTNPRFIVLPIFDGISSAPQTCKRGDNDGKKTVVYVGSLHKWQNVPMILEAAKRLHDRFHFKFLTHETNDLRKLATEHGLCSKLSIDFAPKSELSRHYLTADYGFILRDDIPVNRVACPTKLFEYALFGVIPIILSPDLGDYPAMGYRYVFFSDFMAGNLPNQEQQEEIRQANLECILKLKFTFEHASVEIRKLKHDLPHNDVPAICFLTDYERNHIYPTAAEVTLNSKSGCPPVVIAKGFKAPYDEIKFTISPSETYSFIDCIPFGYPSCIENIFVQILDADGAMVPFVMSGNYAKLGSNKLTAKQKQLRLRFVFESEMRLSQITIRFNVLLLGDEVQLLSARRRFREYVKRIPWIAAIYRAHIKLTG